MGGDDAIGRRLFPVQEAEHGAERGQAHAAIPQAGGTEPVFVEIQAGWGDVSNPLMETGDEQTTYPGVNHVHQFTVECQVPADMARIDRRRA